MSHRSLWTCSVVLLALAGCAPGGAREEAGEERADESSEALGGAILTFGADWSATVTGKLRAGDPIEIRYDEARLPRCRGDQGGVPQWAITAYYQVDDGDVLSVPVVGANAASPVVIVPPSSGELALWFQVTNRWGCMEYDSNFGDDYTFTVGAPAGQPGWVGNGASVISRWTCDDGGPCESARTSLSQAFRFDTWARQRATVAGLYFDVWEEGVTDFDNSELWRQVDAQVHVRFSGEEAFSSRYVDFFRRVGNDARYELRLRSLDPFHAMPSVVAADACPAGALSLTPDGNYVTTEVEFYFTADAVELRPAPGETFKGRFEDYASPYAACL